MHFNKADGVTEDSWCFPVGSACDAAASAPVTDETHPLASVLEPSNGSPFHSNWYQRIEWAADRIFDGAVPGARQTASRLLQKEIDLLRECRCFGDAARVAAALLIHALLPPSGSSHDLLSNLGFVAISPDSAPHVWTLYAPLFENDNVYVRDGMVFTVIHGGQLQCLPELSSQKSALSVSVREAEKAYGVLLKANTMLMDSILEFRRVEALENHGSSASRFAMPLAGLVDYFTLRIFVEPLIPLTPYPFEITPTNFSDSTVNLNDAAIRRQILDDAVFIRQVSYIQNALGLESHPFPSLFHQNKYSDLAVSLGTSFTLSRPQFLYCQPYRKITLRRAIELLPFLVTKESEQRYSLSPKNVISNAITRFRPELLRYVAKTVGVQTVAGGGNFCQCFGRLHQSSTSTFQPLVNGYTENENPVSLPPNKCFVDDCYKDGPNHKLAASPFDASGYVHKEMAEVLLRQIISQLKDMLILLRDSADVSRTLHGMGLPIRYLRRLYSHTELPRYCRDVLAAELIARSARHWFVEATRPRILDVVNQKKERSYDSASLIKDVHQLLRALLGSTTGQSSFVTRTLSQRIVDYWEPSDNSFEKNFTLDFSVNPHLLQNALQVHLGVLFTCTPLRTMSDGALPQNCVDLPKTFPAYIFPDADHIKCLFHSACSGFESTEENKLIASCADKWLQGFFPQVRLVAPETTLPALSAAQDVVYHHLYRNQRLDQFPLFGAASGGSSWTCEEETSERLRKRSPLFIPHQFNVTTLCNMTTFGVIYPLKAAVYGAAAPCNPTCLQWTTDPEMMHLETVGLGVPETQFVDGDSSSKQPSKVPCRSFVQLWTAVRIILLARNALRGNAVYCSGTTHDMGVERYLLALGYVYLQHGYTHHAQCLGRQVLNGVLQTSSVGLYAQELIAQCYPYHEALTVANQYRHFLFEQTAIAPKSSSAVNGTFSAMLFLADISLALHALRIADHETAYVHLSNALSRSKSILHEHTTHWSQLATLLLLVRPSRELETLHLMWQSSSMYMRTVMLRAAFSSQNSSCFKPASRDAITGKETRRFRNAEQICRDLLSSVKKTNTDLSLLKARALSVLASIRQSSKRPREASVVALEALDVLQPRYGCLYPLSLSCLYQAAQALHTWGVQLLESPPLRSVQLPSFDWTQEDPRSIQDPMCPYYEKQFLAQDQTKLVELWGDKERNAARKKAESLYDALFRRIVAKMQQNDLHPVTLHERHVYSRAEFPPTESLTPNAIPLYESPQDNGWSVNLSRLMGVIKNVLHLRLISMSFVEQRRFVGHLIDAVTGGKSEVYYFGSRSTATDASLEQLWDFSAEHVTIAKVQPTSVTSFSVEQQAIIVRLLFDPIVPDVVDALCFQVLKKCCQLSENCNQPCQPMFLCTPNEWYDRHFQKAMYGTGHKSSKAFVILFHLLRACCPNTFKKVFVFHLGIHLSSNIFTFPGSIPLAYSAEKDSGCAEKVTESAQFPVVAPRVSKNTVIIEPISQYGFNSENEIAAGAARSPTVLRSRLQGYPKYPLNNGRQKLRH